jgi:hypothetical protein
VRPRVDKTIETRREEKKRVQNFPQKNFRKLPELFRTFQRNSSLFSGTFCKTCLQLPFKILNFNFRGLKSYYSSLNTLLFTTSAPRKCSFFFRSCLLFISLETIPEVLQIFEFRVCVKVTNCDSLTCGVGRLSPSVPMLFEC